MPRMTFVFTESIVDVFPVPVTMATECIFSAGPASLSKMPVLTLLKKPEHRLL